MKIAALIIAVIAALGFSACSDTPEPKPDRGIKSEPESEVAPEVAPESNHEHPAEHVHAEPAPESAPEYCPGTDALVDPNQADRGCSESDLFAPDGTEPSYEDIPEVEDVCGLYDDSVSVDEYAECIN